MRNTNTEFFRNHLFSENCIDEPDGSYTVGECRDVYHVCEAGRILIKVFSYTNTFQICSRRTSSHLSKQQMRTSQAWLPNPLTTTRTNINKNILKYDEKVHSQSLNIVGNEMFPYFPPERSGRKQFHCLL